MGDDSRWKMESWNDLLQRLGLAKVTSSIQQHCSAQWPELCKGASVGLNSHLVHTTEARLSHDISYGLSG